jgi:hypothetical protein
LQIGGWFLVPSFPSADPLLEKGGGWGTTSLFNIELVDEPSVIHQFFYLKSDAAGTVFWLQSQAAFGNRS